MDREYWKSGLDATIDEEARQAEYAMDLQREYNEAMSREFGEDESGFTSSLIDYFS